MSPFLFHQDLVSRCKKPVKLRFNNNRSTMLSVRWEPHQTNVSIHQMFLDAPKNVMEALVCYVDKTTKHCPAIINRFIHENTKKFDYSQELNRHELDVQGNVYDLQDSFDRMNAEYFQSQLNLALTWYGHPHVKGRRKVTLGLYNDALKLIKIHRVLDNRSCPSYLLDYIMHHEMLHFVHPPYYDKNGRHRIHNKEFKEKEKQFSDYTLAKEWLSQFRKKNFCIH